MASPGGTVPLDALLDQHLLASFALGSVFILAIRGMLSSSFIQSLFRRIFWQESRKIISDAERLSEKTRSLDSDSDLDTTLPATAESQVVLFSLSLCAASASISYFASILPYVSTNGTACSFVVAWGGITGSASRLLGVVALFLRLKSFGMRYLESTMLILGLTAGAALTFTSNAVAPGLLKTFDNPPVSLCYRMHSLPISLTQSLIFTFLEAYCTFRVWSTLSPAFLSARDQISAVQDIWILRGLSLLLFELLITVPSAIETNTLGDFLTYSIGAVVMLVMFFPNPSPNVVHMDSRTVSTRSAAIRTTRTQSMSPYWSSRPTTIDSHQPAYDAGTTHRKPHPFSSMALNDRTLQREEWVVRPPLTARSSKTIDSESVRSVNDAVVRVAQLAHRTRERFGTHMQPFPDDLKFSDSSSGVPVGSAEFQRYPRPLTRDGNLEPSTRTRQRFVVDDFIGKLVVEEEYGTPTLMAIQQGHHSRGYSEGQISSLHLTETLSSPTSSHIRFSMGDESAYTTARFRAVSPVKSASGVIAPGTRLTRELPGGRPQELGSERTRWPTLGRSATLTNKPQSGWEGSIPSAHMKVDKPLPSPLQSDLSIQGNLQ